MRIALLGVAVAGIALVSCGDGNDPPRVTPADATDVLPATSVTTPLGAGTLPDGPLTPADVTVPCPESDGLSGSDAEVDVLAETSRLEPMLGQVLAYGSTFPDEFGSYGLIWQDDGEASVFVSFTGDIDAHRDALEGVVAFPEDLIVCQVAISSDLARALQARLMDELEGRYLMIGVGRAGVVQVSLRANEASLAAELHDRFGDAIDLTVGALAYPKDAAVSVCREAPIPSDLPGLRVEIAPTTEPVNAAGDDPSQAFVTLTNTSQSPIHFISGATMGTLIDADGHVVNSNNHVLVDAMGIGVDLAPGASTDLRLFVSTASCDPDLGFTVPAGQYQLIAEVPHNDGTNTTLTSEPATVTVV